MKATGSLRVPCASLKGAAQKEGVKGAAPILPPVPSRRVAIGSSLLALAAAAAGGRGVAWAETPFEEGKRISTGLNKGRLYPCPGAVNPNCLSTSSTTPDQYAPAWAGPGGADEKEVALVISETVLATVAGATQIKAESLGGDGEYLLFSVPGAFGDSRDALEFLVRPYGVDGRNFAGDEGGGRLITYRSIAGQVNYIWPIQQPITDGDLQRKRTRELRKALQFRLVGCELIECYDN
mmetsp:Transcript_7815/g.26156  ORF Transcript_7815/g.26156 Transcript_7815/m.26156 type:complete len:237 (-) Transcript_7815:335-1045(-)|eukprot:CAMPEP_0182878784 /NCGR_PEP_ID=MMETSP0034_2-20130328/15569_1 /TAXON_ID=156128 /ORGANISM="Nephroselmis pyriformis, Strain CCMP717" /LENGTH=236 /DNA_ID=CAMNT_0025011679 /DNA_START=13 /DNA_END=723 /DNA_ORIENTATION=-